MNIPETLCFSCGNCDCSWMRDLVPVPDWFAVEHTRTTKSGTSTSYRVMSCPEYRKATNEDKHVHSTEGALALISVVAERTTMDYITAKLRCNRNPDDKDAKRDLKRARKFLETGFSGSGEEFNVDVAALDKLIGNCTTMEELRKGGKR